MIPWAIWNFGARLWSTRRRKMAVLCNATGERYGIADDASLTLPDGEWTVGFFVRPTGSVPPFPGYATNTLTFGSTPSFNAYRDNAINSFVARCVSDNGTDKGDIVSTYMTAEGSSAPWVLFVTTRNAALDVIRLYAGAFGTSIGSDDSSALSGSFDAISGVAWEVGEDPLGAGVGEFAEFFICNASSITQEQVDAIAAGVNVVKVLGSNVTTYLPLKSNPATEKDIIGGNDGTKVGSPTVVEHPPIMGGFAPQHINVPAAAPPGGLSIPVAIHEYRQRHQSVF